MNFWIFYFFFVLVCILIFVLVFLLLFYGGNVILRDKSLLKVKVSTFERGFISTGLVQNSFRVHFFIIILMFVIFDLEIVLFLGLIVRDVSGIICFLVLFLFIVGGFYIEW